VTFQVMKIGMKAIYAPGRATSQPNRFVQFVRHGYPGAIPAHLMSFLLEQPTILFGQIDHGSGRRHARQG